MNKSKNERFSECLIDIKKILDENNQEFFLTCGTLLGYVRNNDFIPYDEDIDISILKEKFNIDIIDKIKQSKKFILETTYGSIENSFEVSFRHINNTKIDIFIMYQIKDNYYYSASFNGICSSKKEGYCKWGNTINGFINITFKNNNFLIPSNFEQYLEELYGKNWKIPKKFDYWEGLDGGYKNLIN